jgi:polyhydroxybutyrate depolymerase
MASISHFDEQAKASRFIVAYPDAASIHWEAGGAFGTNNADVLFVGHLLDQLTIQFQIDRTRVFVAGVSNGAEMAYRLACELSDRIAGVASISGAMVVDACRPARPVSILEMHGTDDVLIPYTGGRSGGEDFPSSAAVIQHWLTLDGCPGSPSVSHSGITTTSIWKGCQAGTLVRLDTVEGGHHTWFGSAFDPVDGEPNANTTIGDFFRTVRP